jgi:hypothetical protein
MNHLLNNKQFINGVTQYINKVSSDNIIELSDIPQFMIYIATISYEMNKKYYNTYEVLDELTFVLLNEYSIIPNEIESTIKEHIMSINELLHLVKKQTIKKSLF